MTDEEILNNLKQIFETLNKEKASKITINSDIATDLGLDSVGLVYMAVIIEQSFNIDMGDATINTFKKVSDVVNYIKEKSN